MKAKYKKIIFIWMFLFITILFQKKLLSFENQSLKNKIDNFVKNEQQFQFSGLAQFYNNIRYYIVEIDNISKVESNRSYYLTKSQWLAVVGYKNVLLIKHDKILYIAGKTNRSQLAFDLEWFKIFKKIE